MEQYTYTYQPRQRSPSTVSSRSGGAYQNSSAFSSSANPDEDWTKISDLAERRRIQNRIAQRNYRKKLKRRLEDLERRTTSSSASPEQSYQELARPVASDADNISHLMQRRVSGPRASGTNREQLHASNIVSQEDAWLNHVSASKHSAAFSAPSMYSLMDSHIPTADYFPDDFNSAAFPRLPVIYGNQTYTPDFAESISPALPSMVAESIKSETQYLGGEMITPFNMNYASLAGYSGPMTQSTHYTSRTPPLTVSSIHFDSRDCSPQQFTYPVTPESRSASPNIALFDHVEE